MAVAFFMQMLDGTIIATSLPAMALDFGTDVVSLNIGFTAYLLAMAVCIPPAGWLGDRSGSRNVFPRQTAFKTGSDPSSVQFGDGNGDFRWRSSKCRAAFRS